MNISEKKAIIMNAFFKTTIQLLPSCMDVTVARIIYSDKASSFEALLIKEDSVSIHDRNLELLAIKIYKTSKALFSLIIIELFQK